MEKNLNEVEGFENCSNYVIHDDGKLYAKSSKKWLKPLQDSKGYLYYDLRYRKAKYRCPKVHRLVMLAFSKEQPKEQINHIDGNKKNNHINNLEWCDNTENRKHAIVSGLKKEVNFGIAQYDLEGNFLRSFATCKEALAFLGKDEKQCGNIGRCVNGKRKTAFGYIWTQYEGSTTIPKGSTFKRMEMESNQICG